MPGDGVWIARGVGGGEVIPFPDEISAHRNVQLGGYHMDVFRVPFGENAETYQPKRGEKNSPAETKPTAALIEIVEKDHSTDDNEGVIVPDEVRINGTPLLIPAGQQIKVHSITLNENERVGTHGEDAACVTLTLFARRVTIAADGDL